MDTKAIKQFLKFVILAFKKPLQRTNRVFPVSIGGYEILQSKKVARNASLGSKPGGRGISHNDNKVF